MDQRRAVPCTWNMVGDRNQGQGWQAEGTGCSLWGGGQTKGSSTAGIRRTGNTSKYVRVSCVDFQAPSVRLSLNFPLQVTIPRTAPVWAMRWTPMKPKTAEDMLRSAGLRYSRTQVSTGCCQVILRVLRWMLMAYNAWIVCSFSSTPSVCVL
jgi:hypothetical protein